MLRAFVELLEPWFTGVTVVVWFAFRVYVLVAEPVRALLFRLVLFSRL